MIKKTINIITKQIARHLPIPDNNPANETELLAMGKLLSNQQYLIPSKNINDFEFKIFSQFGDDGIIQYLIKNIHIDNHSFIEFGVENYLESNTRFLRMNNNWAGVVIDGSENNIQQLKSQPWYWQYDLDAFSAFIDTDNINHLLGSPNCENVGLLHIDLDGNDYHILKTLDLKRINPSIIILEYNSVFGLERKITIPYNKTFNRTESHFSNLYWGASLSALTDLAKNKGYVLVGSNIAGNNAYFIRKDLQTDFIYERPVKEVYVESRYRESRNPDGSLSYISGEERLDTIKGLPVLNLETNKIEEL